MNVVIRIEGQQQTIANLSMFDTTRKAAAQVVVRKTAVAVRKEARQRVPVSPSNRKKSSGRPGDLKSSIKNKFYFQGLGAMVLPDRPKGAHRAIVEYGTKQRFTNSGANRGQESAKPFMQPSKDSQEATYNAEMAQIFNTDQII